MTEARVAAESALRCAPVATPEAGGRVSTLGAEVVPSGGGGRTIATVRLAEEEREFVRYFASLRAVAVGTVAETLFDGLGEVVVTDRRLVGLVVEGKSGHGSIDQRRGKVLAFEFRYEDVDSVDLRRAKGRLGKVQDRAVRVTDVDTATVLQLDVSVAERNGPTADWAPSDLATAFEVVALAAAEHRLAHVPLDDRERKRLGALVAGERMRSGLHDEAWISDPDPSASARDADGRGAATAVGTGAPAAAAVASDDDQPETQPSADPGLPTFDHPYAFAAVTDGSSADQVLFPRILDARGAVAFVEADGVVSAFRARGLRVFRGAGKLAKPSMEVRRVDVDLYLTDARLVAVCPHYRKGGLWVGTPGLMLLMNVLSRLWARYHSRSSYLVGQMQLAWVTSVGYYQSGGLGNQAMVRVEACDARDGATIAVEVDLSAREDGRAGAESVARQTVRSRLNAGWLAPEQRAALDRGAHAHWLTSGSAGVAAIPGALPVSPATAPFSTPAFTARSAAAPEPPRAWQRRPLHWGFGTLATIGLVVAAIAGGSSVSPPDLQSRSYGYDGATAPDQGLSDDASPGAGAASGGSDESGEVLYASEPDAGDSVVGESDTSEPGAAESVPGDLDSSVSDTSDPTTLDGDGEADAPPPEGAPAPAGLPDGSGDATADAIQATLLEYHTAVVDRRFRDAWGLLSERRRASVRRGEGYAAWRDVQQAFGRHLAPEGMRVRVLALGPGGDTATVEVAGIGWSRPGSACSEWSGITWFKHERARWRYDPGFSTTPARERAWRTRYHELLAVGC